MKSEGYGKDYQYAHNANGARVKQTHLPEALVGRRFYRPKEVGLEIQLKEKLDRINSDFE
jgi:putative ATPase